MDDSCAVCADALEWVAYGSCGHREVCSTCVVRLRFVLDDRRCCICKTENPIVFITKAMGDYTRVITDFSMFPSGATEGKAGAYWYHEGTQAFFDDVDHYKMIKATCRLSCSVCDKSTEEQGKKTKFRSIEQLKGHLFHQHRLFMCSLCLEGRKVFICEQKLYSRSQLNQHINTGDSEVDGSESERGGFMGHPMCEFCRNPFYGDNELYTHMSTEHYTCHICQRQHPGQYDYYKNYDDLEIHFRQEHFLCEDEACLAKKFIVFLSEAEMKRHNTLEHGGHMSRSQRNAAFQIPTSFRYRRNNEQEHRRGRGRGSRAHQFGFEFRVAETPSTDQGETSQSAPPFTSFESLAINPDAEPPSSRSTPVIEESSFPPLSDREPPEPSSRYAQALHYSRNATRLGEDSFPPLPAAEKTSKPKASHGPKISGKNTLASRGHLHGKGHVATSRSAWARPSENQETGSSRPLSSQIKPTTNPGVSSYTPPISQPRVGTANQGFPSLSTPSVSHPRAEANQGFPSLSTPPISHPRIGPNQGFPSLPTPPTSQPRAGVNQGFPSPSPANGLTPPISANSPWKSSTTNRMRHSSSAPNLIEGGSANLPTPTTVFPEVKEVQTANKSLVERIRASLGMNEDRYAAFKNISGEFRQGQINTWEYLSYVEQFGLLHLVLELARLCPDPKKQKELIDAYNANLRGVSMVSKEDEKKGKGKGKDKGKGVDLGDNNGSRRATDALTDSILDTVRKLQSNNLKPQEEVENLSKDGYRKANNGKAYADSSGSREPPPRPASSSGGSKQKKTAKFQRVRLGDGSAAALLDPGLSIVNLERDSNSDIEEGVIPVRGVWRNGGGMRLVANSQKSSLK